MKGETLQHSFGEIFEYLRLNRSYGTAKASIHNYQIFQHKIMHFPKNLNTPSNPFKVIIGSVIIIEIGVLCISDTRFRVKQT